MNVWCKALPCRTIPCTTVIESDCKKEVNRLTYIDVFNRGSDSKWAAPTFIQAKKTGDV
jgi:hypothetical protein